MANSYQYYTKLITFSYRENIIKIAVSLRGVTVADHTPLVGKFVFIRGGEILYFFSVWKTTEGLLTAGSIKVMTTSTLQIIAKSKIP